MTNRIRVLNPALMGRRKRSLVRVLNPEHSRVLNKARSRSDVEDLFLNFRGRGSNASVLLEARPGTPKVVAELGGLVELVLNAESVRGRALKLIGGRSVATDEDGNGVWKFNQKLVKLVADGDGDMHVAGFHTSVPDGIDRGRSLFLGDVLRVCYRADKPHLESKVHDYEHEFAEHGGQHPRLFFKDGFIFFRGGSYSITPEGIDG